MTMGTGDLMPKDLLGAVCECLDQQPGRWVSPKAMWEFIQRNYPDLASRVREKVSSYVDPVRNNEVWFVSNTPYHAVKLGGDEISNIREVPEMRSESIWLVARAVPR